MGDEKSRASSTRVDAVVPVMRLVVYDADGQQWLDWLAGPGLRTVELGWLGWSMALFVAAEVVL